MQPEIPRTCEQCGSVIPPSERELTTPTLCAQCSTRVATSDAARQPSAGDTPPQDNPAETIIAPTFGDTEPEETLAAGAAVTQSITSSLTGAQLKIGRFEVVENIGHGSFGNVYRAYDPVLDREVALKVPRGAETDGDHAERFTREAKSAARLRHPNIVTVYESGSEGGVMYIASEFVKGVTLSHVIKTEALDLRTSVDWVRQIAEALHYAHHEGVVHRDIKPSNIMVNASRRPQVMDFGLAKRLADEVSVMTVEGQVLGTPAYMSPEQARGEMHLVGPLSDQYSVGVVLYELLCGQRMFVGPAWTVMSRIGNPHDQAARPRSLRQDIPRDLEACCLKATEKQASARYANLGEFAADLERWLDGRPVLARPISQWERFVRWTRKNPLITALTSLLLLVLIVVTVGSVLTAIQFKELATSEAASKHDLARLLVDTYAESGLAAADRNELAQAALWFANASTLAAEHPSRREWNAIRRDSWLAEVATPCRAFPITGYCDSLEYHPSARYLLVKSWNREIHDITTDKLVPLPVSGQVDDLAWSPDGTLLATASALEVVVAKFPSNEVLARWSPLEPVSALAFNSDGSWLAVGGAGTFEIRNAGDGSIVSPYVLVPSRVKSILFSPGDACIAVGTENQYVFVHALTQGAATTETVIDPALARSELSGETRFAFLDDRRIILADTGQSVTCWDLARKSIAWEYPAQRILDLAASPDGSQVALSQVSNQTGHRVVILASGDGTEVEPAVEVNHRNHIHSVRWHPEGHLLLTASADHTVRITSTTTGTAALPAIPHCGLVLRCAWSPDGRTFATALRDGEIVQVWRMPAGRDAAYEFATRGDRPFFKLATSSSGDVVIATGFDSRRAGHVVSVHDAATGQQRGVDIACAGVVSDAEWIEQQHMLVTAGSQSTDLPSDSIHQQDLDQPGIIQFWSLTDGTALLPDVETPSEPIGISATMDGRRIGVICHAGEFLLIDAVTGSVIAERAPEQPVASNHGYMIRHRIRCSPDGSRFATWGRGGLVTLWSSMTGDPSLTVEHDAAFIHDARFSPDGEVLATASEDRTVRVWDAKSGTELAVLQHAGWVLCVRFSEDGNHLLTAAEDRQARVWNWRNESIVCSTPKLSEQVYAACFISPEQFAVGTRDGVVAIWETETGKKLAPPRRMEGAIYQLELHDGLLLVSGRLSSLRAFDLSEWVRAPDAERSDEEHRLIVELVASQTILETGTPTDLTTEEWLARWEELRNLNSDSELFRVPMDE